MFWVYANSFAGMSGKERARASMSAVGVACLEGRRGRSVGRSPSQSNPRLKGKGLASFADHAHYTRGARARRSAGPPWARRVNETPLSDEGTNASCQRAPTRSAEPRRGYRRQAGRPPCTPKGSDQTEHEPFQCRRRVPGSEGGRFVANGDSCLPHREMEKGK